MNVSDFEDRPLPPPTAEERRREAAYLAAERAAIQADGCTEAELAREAERIAGKAGT